MTEANNSSAGATFSDRVNGSTLFFLSQMILKTCKFQVTNLKWLTDAMGSGRPLIFAGWHGLTMMMEPLIQRYHEDMSRHFGKVSCNHINIARHPIRMS